MTEYVIDENVVRNAWHGKRPDNSDAVDEMLFLAEIFACKGHVNMSSKIRNKFNKYRKDTQHITRGVNDLMLTMFIKMIKTKENVEGLVKRMNTT